MVKLEETEEPLKPSKPQILVAMPSLQDGYFDKSVILLCEYNEDGAMGFVINSPSTTSVDDLLLELGLRSNPPQKKEILIGGPVQPELCWVVHSTDYMGQSTTLLGDELALSAAQEVLTSITEGVIPEYYMLGVGYAGWASKQLDKEIEQDSWWLADIDLMPILRAAPEARWHMVMEKLGFNLNFTSYCTA
ncbi:MAG: YqgE/AlgH family protein [Candidatus Lambdaproteobacteria bacterium]|nr:YqgE/AlgH family protein [Candidatus Lambdaproteobacteria bacterium]